MEEKWFRTDITIELLSSLKFLNKQLLDLDANHDWRWVIIGGAYSLQCACACALHQCNTLGIFCLEETSMEKWYEYFHDRSNEAKRPVKKRVASTRVLLKRCIVQDYFPASLSFKIEESQIHDCQKLISFRDKFMHFDPQAWSIETSGFPRIINSLMLTINHIVEKLPQMARHINQETLTQMNAELDSLRIELSKHPVL